MLDEEDGGLRSSMGRTTGRDGIVVFWARRDSRCGECGRELAGGSLIRLRDGEAFCMECADLDHLVFLPAGDAALTRRASKHSRLRAVVVRWSRSRKRYERQGILVEEEAAERAERECLSDADQREARRRREAERREWQDLEYVRRFASAIRQRYPEVPDGVDVRIAEHACRKYSGRVGRSAAAKQLDPQTIDLAVRAHIRHVETSYDDHLLAGWERDGARAAVEGQTEAVLAKWRDQG